MLKPIIICGALFALAALAACSSSVDVGVNLAPIHATLATAAASQAPDAGNGK